MNLRTLQYFTLPRLRFITRVHRLLYSGAQLLTSTSFLFISTLVMTSCVEPFEPEVGDYESTLVVDGLFHDGDSPSIITLSRSFGYNEEEVQFIENAIVVIEDDQGRSSQLEEASPGVYQTDPDGFRGEVGKSYRLLIQADSEQFESDWQLMKTAPPISDIYFEIEERIPDDPDARPILGAQFYLNTKDNENQTIFYRWDWAETYIYINPYPPFIRVEFSGPMNDPSASFFNITGDDFAGLECWKTNFSRDINIATTENLAEDVIEAQPLHFVDNSSPRLYLRYSLLVKQYAISEEYYRFLNKVEQLNETTGSLFDPIPNEVFGNIRSSNDQNIPVLGYFGVGGISQKRIFVVREDLPLGFSAPPSPNCRQDTVAVGDFRRLYESVENGGRILHNYLIDDISPAILGYLITVPRCAFCEENGASNVEPDFW